MFEYQRKRMLLHVNACNGFLFSRKNVKTNLWITKMNVDSLEWMTFDGNSNDICVFDNYFHIMTSKRRHFHCKYPNCNFWYNLHIFANSSILQMILCNRSSFFVVVDVPSLNLNFLDFILPPFTSSPFKTKRKRREWLQQLGCNIFFIFLFHPSLLSFMEWIHFRFRGKFIN